ncbi:DUF4097 family beta strand repeat-containing protein [Angustibacter aerolatus]
MAEQWEVGGPKVIEVGGADEPVRELVIGLVNGRIDVVAHDGDTADVEVAGVRGRPLQVTWGEGRLEIAHPHQSWSGLLETLRAAVQRDDRAEVTVQVPRGTAVRISTVQADGLLHGLHAAASVRTVSGELVVDGVHGPVESHTISGRIDVRDQHGPLRGNTVSGSLTVSAAELPSLSVKTVSGELVVDLASAPSEVELKSVSGDLVVRIPGPAGYRLEARSVSGQVVADGQRLRGEPGAKGGRAIDGDESVRVVATTVSGSITLLRGRTPDAGPAAGMEAPA